MENEVNLMPTSCSPLHVVFVVDTTGSMQEYLKALKQSLLQVSALLKISFPSSSADISIITYKDYCKGGKYVLKKQIQGSYKELSRFCSELNPSGGGDLAEASKTAFNYLGKLAKAWKDDKMVVFHYTDAPPHHRLTNPNGLNRAREREALSSEKPGFDWCRIARRFRKIADRVKIFTICPDDSPAGQCGSAFYGLLGHLITLYGYSTQSRSITQTTMSILLQLLGQEREEHSASTNVSKVQLVSFREHEDVMERLLNGDECDEDTFPEINTDACKVPTWTATAENHDMVRSESFLFEAIPEIEKIDFSTLKESFKHDANFRDLVFRVMEDLIHPESVMALTTNPVFGRLWRLVCNTRDDERLTRLVATMGGCATSKILSAEERTTLKRWIEDSYDYAEEINEAIKLHHKEGTRVYVLDTFPKDSVPTVDGLRSLGRAPSPDALANLQKLLSHVMLVDTQVDDELPVDDDGNCRYLPHDMDDYQLFTMLPHLLRAGTKYSLKPAALLAMICCKSANSLLAPRAHRFLCSIRGKWLPPVARIDRAEIISYEFSSLIANCQVEGAFTEEERQFFFRLHEIWRYRRGRFTNFDVVTHFSTTKPALLPDFKKICRSCHEWTSTTLMDHKRTCGICLWMAESSENVWVRPRKNDPYFVDREESYMVECTSCQAMYAVLGPADLKVPPKCHYCRGLDQQRRARHGAPYRRCGCCQAKWCDPSLAENDESLAFICPVCAHGGATTAASPVPTTATSTHSVSLQQIMTDNPLSVTKLGFRKKAASIIFSGCKMYQSVAEDRPALFLPPREDVVVPLLIYKGKVVINEDLLLQTIRTTIASATFVSTCQLCFEELPVEKVRSACGNCLNQCCQDCLRSWYRQNAPGQLFIPCHDMCPFCRQRPRYKVLSAYNHQACGIVGLGRRNGAPLRLRADWYYGWCKQCWRVAFAMERRCAEGIPALAEFTCEDCVEKKRLRELAAVTTENEHLAALLVDSQPCPGCGIRTTHVGGCSHMTCSICAIHWCYQCGTFQADTAGEVYDHMEVMHGGYGWQ